MALASGVSRCQKTDRSLGSPLWCRFNWRFWPIDLTLKDSPRNRMNPSNDASQSARAALAATVALVCLIAGAALAGLLGGGATESARAKRLAQTPSDVAPDHVHGADLGVPGTSERRLRALETRTLGAAHAREHALMRRSIREAKQDTSAAGADSVAAAPKLAAAADAAPD